MRQLWDPMLRSAACMFNHSVPGIDVGARGFGMITTIITTTTRFRGASG